MDKLELIVVGHGTAFDVTDHNANLAVWVEDEYGERLVALDFGITAPRAWVDLGLDFQKIAEVYISHAHDDHMGALGNLAFRRFFVPGAWRPRLLAHSTIIPLIWQSLEPGLSSLQGRVANLSTYFEPVPISSNSSMNVGWAVGQHDGHQDLIRGTAPLELSLVQMIHVYNGLVFMPSFGLLLKVLSTGKVVFWTSDTQFAPAQLRDFYAKADLIIHDCEMLPGGLRSGVHAHFDDLATLPEETKKKMWLIHYQEKYKDLFDVDKAGFAGLCRRGQVFDLLAL